MSKRANKQDSTSPSTHKLLPPKIPPCPSGDAAKAVGVTVGISYTEYYLNSAHHGMTAYTATSGTLSVVCGRISFTFGLKGPSISIDTACSSSLVGAHLACTTFADRGCARSLVCGVNLTMRAETTAVLSKAGMLAQVCAICLDSVFLRFLVVMITFHTIAWLCSVCTNILTSVQYPRRQISVV